MNVNDSEVGRLVNIRRRVAEIRSENPTHWAAAYRDDVQFLLDLVERNAGRAG